MTGDERGDEGKPRPRRRDRSLPRGIGYLAAPIAVAVATAAIFVVDSVFHLANTTILYLLAVLSVAVAFGSGPAVLAAVVSILAVDWFFVAPIHSLRVATSTEWIELAVFLITAIVTGQLAAEQRQRAREADLREREAVILSDVVRLMSDPDLERALRAVAERLRDELDLAAVIVDLSALDPRGKRPARAEIGRNDALATARSVPKRPSDVPSERIRSGSNASDHSSADSASGSPHRPAPETYIQDEVAVTAEGRTVGTILVLRPSSAPAFGASERRLLTAAAVQLGLAAERARLRQEATEAEILRRGDDLKTSLLHAVSHDLRTPLSTILASAGSLRQVAAGWSDEERDELARRIESEARRLNRIVENLLDLSRIQGGALQPQLAWYDLRMVVDDVIARLDVLFPDRRFVVDVPEDVPPVVLDCVLVDQIVSNLVENAVKYGSPSREVSVAARVVGDEAWVEVADRGPGVAPETIDRLFEPFYRVSGSGPRSGGLGIGLAVVRGLVEAQGGRVWAANRPDGGLAVTISLRLAETAQSDRKR